MSHGCLNLVYSIKFVYICYIDPGAPRGLRVIDTTDTSITIGFKTPAIMQWNVEALSNFRVCWTEYDESNHDDPCDAFSSVSVNNANDEDFEYTYTARGLAPGARYFFSVGVISNRGRSSLATSELLVSTVGKQIGGLYVIHRLFRL